LGLDVCGNFSDDLLLERVYEGIKETIIDNDILIKRSRIRARELLAFAPCFKIRNKLWASWDVAKKLNKGVASVYGWAYIFFYSIVAPKKVSEFSGYVREIDIPGVRSKSARKDFVASILSDPEIKHLKALGCESFVSEFRAIVTSGVDFGKALFPKALAVLEELKNMGPSRIWTQGDMYGGIGQKKWPGSNEQRCKLECVGVFSEYCREHWHTVVASEDKWGPPFQETVEQFTTWGITSIFVLDDKLENLNNAKCKIKSILHELGKQVEVKVIAVGQGDRGLQEFKFKLNKITLDELKKQYNAVENIDEVPDKVRELLKEESYPEAAKPAFILDWDDVFSDDLVRQLLQQKAVIRLLEKLIKPDMSEYASLD
jgi:hypothetical protein